MRVKSAMGSAVMVAGLWLACVLGAPVSPAAAATADVVGPASESSATGIQSEEAQPVSNCACDELGELIRLIVKRFGVPLPTLPPPPGVWFV